VLSTERIGAFIEYVARPLTEDIRVILERAQQLNLPITEKVLFRVGGGLALAHLAGEIVRAITYIVITGIVCRTVLQILP